MRSGGELTSNEKALETGGGNPWADMAETVPPFNLDRNNDKQLTEHTDE